MHYLTLGHREHRGIMCTTLLGCIGVLCAQPYQGHGGHRGIMCTTLLGGIGVLCAQPNSGHRGT